MNKQSTPFKPAMRPALLCALVSSAVLLMSGCSMVPVYERPALAVPAQLPQEAASGAAGGVANTEADAQATRAIVDLPWASYFPDARLQGLIRLALDNNRDLRVAVLNIDQLRAAYQIQNADRFPTLNGSISGTRQPSTASPYPLTTSVTGGVTVSAFELDLFGRLRGLSAAAAAQVLAAQANQQAVRTALIASVANAEIALQADEALLKVARDTVNSRDQSVDLTRQRFNAGVANELDLRSAESAFQAAQAVLVQTQRQQVLDQNALVLLLGGSLPADLPAPTGDLADFEPLAELPAGVPSEVLTRRPDIRQAEFALAATDANIDAARSAFWPRITLTGQFGTASGQLSGLFKNTAWSFAPSLVQPIFDAGRNRANLSGARANRDIALAQYEKAIQTAFREVADGLSNRFKLDVQRLILVSQVDAETRRLDAAEQRYSAGVASALDRLDAQRSLFAAQQSLVQVQSQRAQNLVALYRALGGGG